MLMSSFLTDKKVALTKFSDSIMIRTCPSFHGGAQFVEQTSDFIKLFKLQLLNGKQPAYDI